MTKRDVPSLDTLNRDSDTTASRGGLMTLTDSVDLSTILPDQTVTGSYTVKGLRANAFGRVLDALPIPALLLDGSWSVRFANVCCLKMGAVPRVIEGQSFSVIIPKQQDVDALESMLQEVFSTRKPLIREAIVGAGESRRWCRLHVRALRLGQDRLILLLIEDLTAQKRELVRNRKHSEELQRARNQLERRVAERTADLVKANEQLQQEILVRKRAEEELRESEERFRTIFEAAQDCIFVKDSSLRYTHVNPAMAKLFGVPASRLVGITDGELFDEAEAAYLAELDQRVLGGDLVEDEHTRMVARIPTTFHEIRVPIRDSSGTIVGICGILRNITDRKKAAGRRGKADSIKVASAAMKATLELASVVAIRDTTVLLMGESGTGKDYLARLIHDTSMRASGPFFSIDCAALAPELMESELFGHEAGSFTGAHRRKRGLLELSEGGTILLNEIGELALHLQSKLLSFLDTRSFTRVGGESLVRVNSRIIAATNRDLTQEVSHGRFRLDLLYRLNVVTIEIPPLRERIDDLPILVGDIMGKLASDMGYVTTPMADPGFMDQLVAYDWPGNVRELRNVLERYLILPADKQPNLQSSAVAPAEKQWSFTAGFPRGRSLNAVTRDLKRAMVEEAIRRSKGNQKAAAQLLGIPYDSLRHYVASLGIKK